MSCISLVAATVAAKHGSLLQPSSSLLPHVIQYCDRVRKSDKAKENEHFHKLQREQLEALRRKAERDQKKLAELEKKVQKAAKKIKRDDSD